MTKILITGGSSFLGKHLVDYLKDKYEVLAPTHQELDVTDELQVKEYLVFNEVDTVIHAAHAGNYYSSLPDAVEANMRMCCNLARMADFYKRLIYISSGAIYDKARSLNMVSEKEIGEYVPQDQYGFSKFLVNGGYAWQKNSIVLVPFAIYGEGEEDTRFPTYAIKRAMDNEVIGIEKDAWFDYLYVDDFCRIVEHIMQYKGKLPSVVNVGRGIPYTLSYIAEQAQLVANSISKYTVHELGLANAYTCNTELLKSLLPKDFKYTPMDEGLEKMYQAYKKEKRN